MNKREKNASHKAIIIIIIIYQKKTNKNIQL